MRGCLFCHYYLQENQTCQAFGQMADAVIFGARTVSVYKLTVHPALKNNLTPSSKQFHRPLVESLKYVATLITPNILSALSPLSPLHYCSTSTIGGQQVFLSWSLFFNKHYSIKKVCRIWLLNISVNMIQRLVGCCFETSFAKKLFLQLPPSGLSLCLRRLSLDGSATDCLQCKQCERPNMMLHL